MTEYFEEYEDLGTGADARGPALLQIDPKPEGVTGRLWRVRQIFEDPGGDRDWGISANVDLDASDREGAAVVTVERVGPLSRP